MFATISHVEDGRRGVHDPAEALAQRPELRGEAFNFFERTSKSYRFRSRSADSGSDGQHLYHLTSAPPNNEIRTST